ncbi:MAG: ABC transporter ATP-binding protein [Peptoniphilaceae bacterium]|nr:ABC transporter ATP-binding protein [Peptoniphilaceae bacterium]MDY6085905.1 ABC transporter ATP-binding protein [Peptoniphilaceae bacterium]
MIEFKHVTKIFDGTNAVDDLTVSIPTGEFAVFIGTSGSGKTTSMRMINRMIDPTSGSLKIDGKETKELDPVQLRRRIGYVIQQIGLMPHMTIYENITMVPRLLGWDEKQMRETAERLISRVDLPTEYLERYPKELSGGQQQRIGVIRALAANQDIILMDEPFGALDPITRDSLQKLVKTLQIEMGKTVVFVTHDMDEALSLADHIIIMDKGRLIQEGKPNDILLHPANEFVENFLGADRVKDAAAYTRTVDEIMLRAPVAVTTQTDTRTAFRILREKRVDRLYVTDVNGVLCGYVDIYDLMRLGRKEMRVGDIMKDTVYIHEKTTIHDAMYSIIELNYPNLPVTDDHYKLVGLVTRGTIVASSYESVWGDNDEPAKDVETIISSTDRTNGTSEPSLKRTNEARSVGASSTDATDGESVKIAVHAKATAEPEVTPSLVERIRQVSEEGGRE